MSTTQPTVYTPAHGTDQGHGRVSSETTQGRRCSSSRQAPGTMMGSTQNLKLGFGDPGELLVSGHGSPPPSSLVTAWLLPQSIGWLPAPFTKKPRGRKPKRSIVWEILKEEAEGSSLNNDNGLSGKEGVWGRQEGQPTPDSPGRQGGG